MQANPATLPNDLAMTDFDIAICGAGPVGMTLATLLVKHGVAVGRIVLIDAKTVEQAAADPRSIALSYGSRQILESVGAWPIACDPIEQIHVSRRGHFGRTLIDRSDYRLPALGYVSRYGTLVAALDHVICHTGIASLRPARVVRHDDGRDAVALHLSDGQTLTAGIVIQAEGGVFGAQEARQVQRDYKQTAIIAQVEASAPLPQRAFERFTDEGPIALLPQEGGYALVWCMRPDNALQVMALDDAMFLASLQRAFGERVGRFLRTGPRHAYPLGLNAGPVASNRIVAIGNAAQTLHPVAGQGLNLGLRDAVVLARLLRREMSASTLQDFHAQRRADRQVTIQLTDGLARLFSSTPDRSFPQTLLGFSLALTDMASPLKRALAGQMMFGSR